MYHEFSSHCMGVPTVPVARRPNIVVFFPAGPCGLPRLANIVFFFLLARDRATVTVGTDTEENPLAVEAGSLRWPARGVLMTEFAHGYIPVLFIVGPGNTDESVPGYLPELWYLKHHYQNCRPNTNHKP